MGSQTEYPGIAHGNLSKNKRAKQYLLKTPVQ